MKIREKKPATDTDSTHDSWKVWSAPSLILTISVEQLIDNQLAGH